MSRPQGHIAVGRIRSVEKPNDLTGNRTRDLPACSMVPQPTTLKSTPLLLLLLFLHAVHCLTEHSVSEAESVSVFRWKCGINFSEPLDHASRDCWLTWLSSPHLLRNTEFQYRLHKIMSLAPTLSKLTPLHNLISHLYFLFSGLLHDAPSV
jgi:hypothetical protein